MSADADAVPAQLGAILVLDDEPLISMMLESMLAELGATSIFTAGDVQSAQRMVDANQIDCVVLDVNIRGVESYPFADFLIQRGIPLVFSTGMEPRGLPERFRGHPTLEKPFREDDLKTALLHALK